MNNELDDYIDACEHCNQYLTDQEHKEDLMKYIDDLWEKETYGSSLGG